jgi:hypothetical protein
VGRQIVLNQVTNLSRLNTGGIALGHGSRFGPVVGIVAGLGVIGGHSEIVQ